MIRFRLACVTSLMLLFLPVIRCAGATRSGTQAPSGSQTPVPIQVSVQTSVPSLQAAGLFFAEADASLAPTKASTATPTATPSPSPTPVPTPFCLYWVSDTQVYAYKYPQIFNKMFAYMANEHTRQNALGVLLTGDIVDNRHLQRHWDNAQAALHLLDQTLPLWCVAGNHDVGADSAEYETYLSYGFCAVNEPDRLYKNGVCWFDSFWAGGQEWLLLGIGWQKDTEYISWAKEALHAHPDATGILLVHSFLTDNGGLTSNGKTLSEELLAACPNLRLVLCGHNDGSARWEKEYADGHRVNALMYNFQDDKKQGLGYLRILTFDPPTHALQVTTYSPWFDDYNYYADESRDTFTLSNAW